MAAASPQTLVPRGLLDAVAGNHLLAVVGLGRCSPWPWPSARRPTPSSRPASAVLVGRWLL
jgi:hypothetical protein